jgi:hypothetical protein
MVSPDVAAAFSGKEYSEIRIIETGQKGYLAGIKDDRLHVVFPGITHASDLNDKHLIETSTGAQAYLDPRTAYSSGFNKYIRVWADQFGTEGIRLSWTNWNLALHGAQQTSFSPDMRNPQKGIWNHMELFVDAKRKIAVSRVNGKKQFEVDWSSTSYPDSIYSSTIGLIGFNGKFVDFQETQLDHIYMDNRIDRVLISNQATLEEGATYNVLPIIRVDRNTISAIVYAPAIQPGKAYIHYINDIDPVGSQAIMEVCFRCDTTTSKPSAPVLMPVK